jgi:hypothetical protein
VRTKSTRKREQEQKRLRTFVGELDSVAQRVGQHLSDTEAVSRDDALVVRLNIGDETQALLLSRCGENVGILKDVGEEEWRLFKQ